MLPIKKFSICNHELSQSDSPSLYFKAFTTCTLEKKCSPIGLGMQSHQRL